MPDSVIHTHSAGPRRMALIRSLAAVLIVLPTTLSGCRLEVEPEEDVSLEPYVAQMLETSAAAWNRGDLEAFLFDYQDAPSTTFVGSRGILSGIDEIRGNYASSFGPGAERDSLRFESIRVRTLTPMIGIVTARWVLHEDGVTRAAGPCTLIVRRTGAGWMITHEHSSSDPAPAGN
ncbi:MAG: DUF4440 domain-containing protein [Gemmatimonadetes bacterium]|nr:DUF4440 domain-containing protein [Gemmatimonadota bacterium]